MSLFGTRYAFTMRMRSPDGSIEDIVITGDDLDDFGKKAFMAGFRFAREHEDWQERRPGGGPQRRVSR